jgi:hypothetical protein
MSAKELINWRALSVKLTGNPENVRRNKVPKRFQKLIKELDDLLIYWSKRTDDEVYEINSKRKSKK